MFVYVLLNYASFLVSYNMTLVNCVASQNYTKCNGTGTSRSVTLSLNLDKILPPEPTTQSSSTPTPSYTPSTIPSRTTSHTLSPTPSHTLSHTPSHTLSHTPSPTPSHTPSSTQSPQPAPIEEIENLVRTETCMHALSVCFVPSLTIIICRRRRTPQLDS